MIDVVFDASIAEVLDDHIERPAPQGRALRPGHHRRLGGPARQGHRVASSSCTTRATSRAGGPLWGYVRGGMGMISFAIADAAQEAGATLATGVPVARDPPRGGRPCSRTARLIRATTVVCNADPKVALRLLGDHAPADFRTRLEDWQLRSPVVKFNAALNRLPNWTAAPGQDFPARGTVDVTTGLDAAQSAFDRCAARRGRRRLRRDLRPDRPRPDARARAGKHLLSVFGQYAPYDFDWDNRREEVAQQFIDLIATLRARLPGLPRALRGARAARHRGSASASPAATSSRARRCPTRCGSTACQPRTPLAGRLPVRRRHPPGGQRDRAQRPQRGDGGARGRAGACGGRLKP